MVQTRQQKKPNISNDQFYEFFTSINAPELDMFMAQDDDDGNDKFENNFDRRELLEMFEELESPIAENEVVNSVKQLTSNKSPGPDLLINELFIHGQNDSVQNCTIFFNKIFESGHLPTCWSKGIIVSIHKKVRYMR